MKNLKKKKQVVHKVHDIVRGHIKRDGIKVEIEVPLCNPKRKTVARLMSQEWKHVTCRKCLELM